MFTTTLVLDCEAMLWPVVLLLTALCWYAAFRWRRRRMYELAAPLPGPPALPFLGIACQLVGSTEKIMQQLKNYSYFAINNKGIIKGWLGPILYLLLVDPIDSEVILKCCLEKDDLHRFLRVFIGHGLIFAPVSIWRRRRKIMIPTFSPRVLEQFVDIFAKQSQTLAEHLAEQHGAEPFSVWPFLSTYTLDSVSETTMGVNIGAQRNRNTPFLISLNKVLNLACQRIFHLWLQPEWLYKMLPVYRQSEANIKVLHNFTDEIIRNKVEEIRSKGEEIHSKPDKEIDVSSYTKKTFLELLISLSGGAKGYSNIELREEVLTLIIAGTDTSAVALGFTLVLLAKYPEVQERVYEEIREVFGDSFRPLVNEDLPKLRYMERVIKETIRLFPPVPFIIRKVEEDIKLPSGKIVPAGSGVVISIWGAHRDPAHWGPQAEHFDPDRFLPERFTLKHPCSYMPFSNGPRNCLGYRYAMTSVKTALAAVLRRCRILGEPEHGPVPHIDVKLDVMMKATDGYKISVSKRQ